jgi:NhaA family Na+:H+ antiporter
MSGSGSNDKMMGIILALCALAAIIACNSPLADLYNDLIQVHVSLQFGKYALGKSLVLWVNEGFMALFFLLVTLEIKREMTVGTLNTHTKRALPFFAAIGGMIVPALIYIILTRDQPQLFPGWAIPTATDIVFALSLLGIIVKNCPQSIRSFLLALAVFDDIGAILIIAVYYSNDVSLLSVGIIALCSGLLYYFYKRELNLMLPYILVGILLWVCVLKSGVHATLAGIIVALAFPNQLATRVEHGLTPWVNYFILPVFAFTNAGIAFTGTTISHFVDIMPVAIVAGLVIGKQIGITLCSFLAVKLRLASLPDTMGWKEVWGVAMLCGVGFTMSLFIGTLAFESQLEQYALWIRVGVMGGSLLSALCAWIYFHAIRRTR